MKMTITQLAHNMKIEGGFSSALARLIPLPTGTSLPALGVCAFIRTGEHGSTETNWK